MGIFTLILMVLGFVLLLIAAFFQPAPAPPTRPLFGWLGLACWLLAEILIKAGH